MQETASKSPQTAVDSTEVGGTHAPMVEGLPGHVSSAIDLRLFWDKRRTLFRWVIVGFVLSTLIAFLIPSRFESVARLMPPDQTNSGIALLAAAAGSSTGGASSGAGGLGSGLGSIAGDLLGLKSSGELFVGVLQSRTVQDDLINKFDLRKVYWDRYLEDARKDLDKYTDVSADRKSGIITIRVTDRNPQRAAGLTQEYVSELNRVVVLLNTSSAHREREFLEERLTQVNGDLESAEKEFSGFASQNTALDIPTQGKAMIEATAELEGQLIGAQTELQGLKQIYSDGNVRVRAIQARVDELRHQLQKIGGKYDSATESSGQDDQSMFPSIKMLPVLGVKYADLYRATKVEEAVFETLTKEYELAKIEEAKDTPSIKILDAPNVPEKKSYPPRMLIIGLGTILAMAMSVVWIYGIAYWEEIDPQDPHKVLAVEISQATKSRLPWAFGHGSGNGHSNGWFRSRNSEKTSDLDRHE